MSYAPVPTAAAVPPVTTSVKPDEVTAEIVLKQQSERLSKYLRILLIVDAISCLAIITIPQCAIYIALSLIALHGAKHLKRAHLKTYYWIYIIWLALSAAFSLWAIAWMFGHNAGSNSSTNNNDYNQVAVHSNDHQMPGAHSEGFPGHPGAHSEGFPGAHSEGFRPRAGPGGFAPSEQRPGETSGRSGNVPGYPPTYHSGSASYQTGVPFFWILLTFFLVCLETILLVIRIYTVILARRLVREMEKCPDLVERLGNVKCCHHAMCDMPRTEQQPQQQAPVSQLPQQPIPYSVGMLNGQPVMFIPMQVGPNGQPMLSAPAPAPIPAPVSVPPQYVAAAPSPAPAPAPAATLQTPAVQQVSLPANMNLYPKVN